MCSREWGTSDFKWLHVSVGIFESQTSRVFPIQSCWFIPFNGIVVCYLVNSIGIGISLTFSYWFSSKFLLIKSVYLFFPFRSSVSCKFPVILHIHLSCLTRGQRWGWRRRCSSLSFWPWASGPRAFRSLWKVSVSSRRPSKAQLRLVPLNLRRLEAVTAAKGASNKCWVWLPMAVF